MADFKIKSASGTGNKTLIQGQDQSDSNYAIQIGDGGASTLHNATITAGTFPTGMLVQAVCNPTIVSNTTTHTSEAVAASVTGQITITSGNGVLIYVQANLYIDRSNNDMGFLAQLKEGTATSGALISECRSRDTNTAGNWHEPFSLIGFDSSPADTTPDYCLTIQKLNDCTVALSHPTNAAASLKFMLFEIRQ
tara:strand:- start:407 stop:988 length:582 start_codon:yes stop_codon:yes gene_type:complete